MFKKINLLLAIVVCLLASASVSAQVTLQAAPPIPVGSGIVYVVTAPAVRISDAYGRGGYEMPAHNAVICTRPYIYSGGVWQARMEGVTLFDSSNNCPSGTRLVSKNLQASLRGNTYTCTHESYSWTPSEGFYDVFSFAPYGSGSRENFGNVPFGGGPGASFSIQALCATVP